MQLENLSAIVTGGASGMGKACVQALRARGVKVAIFDCNSELADITAKECGAIAIECNVTSDTSCVAAFAKANEQQGIARIVINCAGVAPAARIVGREGNAMPLADFARVIDINLVGTFNIMRLAAADMIKCQPIGEECGVIINTASIAAYEGQIGQVAYSASKGGIVSMTLPAARELAKFKIRVNTIAPGLIATPLLLGMPQEVQDSLAQTVPFPARLGRSDEFASLVMHVIDNTLINGEVIRLDGALRMQPK